MWVKYEVAPPPLIQDNYACLQELQQPYGCSQGTYGWGPWLLFYLVMKANYFYFSFVFKNIHNELRINLI